jgi:hypothetical protein
MSVPITGVSHREIPDEGSADPGRRAFDGKYRLRMNETG